MEIYCDGGEGVEGRGRDIGSDRCTVITLDQWVVKEGLGRTAGSVRLIVSVLCKCVPLTIIHSV